MKARAIVGENIRRLRVARGMVQEALATDANVDPGYVSRLERGMANPTVDVLERMAGALEAELVDLFVRSPRAAPKAKNLPRGRPKLGF